MWIPVVSGLSCTSIECMQFVMGVSASFQNCCSLIYAAFLKIK